jgi:hypothetical protein
MLAMDGWMDAGAVMFTTTQSNRFFSAPFDSNVDFPRSKSKIVFDNDTKQLFLNVEFPRSKTKTKIGFEIFD